MRAGGCTVQQALTPEAASVVKQAVTLARRRGHAQVTPLHVANTMLTAATGLLRTACLQSHSHPLQCKALELCFNVALNRLPASTSNPMLGSHSQFPSISNALVAAFKRAQAHQRRGSIENQQQPILAVKIELEQLIISILDDPSVSRVMREAGFSSTQVKSNVEQAVSLEICSQNSTASALSSKSKESSVLTKVAEPIRVSSSLLSDPIAKNEDVMYVINNLMSRKRRNFVIVGECVGNIEGLAREVIERVQKGDVPEGLRDLKFITIPFTSFGNLNRLEIEQKIEEIKSLLRVCIGRGVVLNMGNLEYWVDSYSNRVSSGCDEQIRGYYCSVEHMIMELGKLVCGIGEQSRFWVMGFATFQTYMRCKSGRPSLETVWGLHPLTIPAASLSLSLSTDSELQSQSTNKRGENVSSSRLLLEGRELTCCADCSVKFEAEARNLQRNTDSMITSTKTQLPAWLQQYKNDQNKELLQNNDKGLALRDLCRKWNSICNSIHKQQHYCLERTLTFSSISPSSSTSVGFSYDLQHQYPNFNKTHHDNWSTTAVEPKNHSLKEHPFLIPETISSKNNVDHCLKIFIPDYNDPKQLFPSSNPNSTPNSVSSSSDIMEIEHPRNRFRELNPENLTTLCNALEKKVPWQRDIIPDIASTVLKCRAGDVARRKGNEAKEETWLFFQGADVEAKEKIAKELARFVFGSRNNFVSIALSNFSSSMTRADSTEDIIISRNKRSRDEQSCSTYIERFTEAVSINPHRVFLIEDVDQADYFSLKGFKRAIEVGKLIDYNGDGVGLGDAIIILSCESFSSRSRACSPSVKERSDGSHDEEKATAAQEITSPSVSLDLNISIDDDVITEDQSVGEIGLLESVDKRVIFKILEL